MEYWNRLPLWGKYAVGGAGVWIGCEVLRGLWLKSFSSVYDLHDCTALVTGASRGVGREVVKKLSKIVRCVIVVARDEAKLNSLKSELAGARAEIVVLPLDLSDAKRARDAIVAASSVHGPLRIVVNSAGAGAWRFLWEKEGLGYEHPSEFMNVPTLAAAVATAGAAPSIFRFAGENRAKHFFGADAHVINVQSAAAHASAPGATLYSVSRVALAGLCRSTRADFCNTRVLGSSGKVVQPRVTVTEAIFSEISGTDYFETNPGTYKRLPWLAMVVLGRTTVEGAAQNIVSNLYWGYPTTHGPTLLALNAGLLWLWPSLVDILGQISGVHPTVQVSPKGDVTFTDPI